MCQKTSTGPQGAGCRGGTSLSDYVRGELTRVARTPTPEELDERIRTRAATGVSTRDILAARDRGRRE